METTENEIFKKFWKIMKIIGKKAPLTLLFMSTLYRFYVDVEHFYKSLFKALFYSNIKKNEKAIFASSWSSMGGKHIAWQILLMVPLTFVDQPKSLPLSLFISLFSSFFSFLVCGAFWFCYFLSLALLTLNWVKTQNSKENKCSKMS